MWKIFIVFCVFPPKTVYVFIIGTAPINFDTMHTKISSDDYLTPPPSMSAGNYMQSSHTSPTHNVNNPQSYHHQSHQSHYSTGTLTPLMHSTHQQQSQLLSNDTASVSNIPVSVSVNPMQPSRSTTPKKWVSIQCIHCTCDISLRLFTSVQTIKFMCNLNRLSKLLNLLLF